MTGTEGAADAAPNPIEVVSTRDAAAECAVSVAEFISLMVDAGTLLVIPGTEDPRCDWRVFDGIRWHVEDCECGFIPVPHPDLVELGR